MIYVDPKHKFIKLHDVFFFLFSGAMMPFFPENVDNVTVQIGQSAELRCKVENLNNYKVQYVTEI